MLAKVHLQELYYLKQKNNVLTKNVEELQKRLASQDIESEIKGLTKVKLTKYKCDHCMFEAKSMRGIKTHSGHMHKDLEETVESTHAIQIYKCALSNYFYNNKDELERHEEEH